MLTRIVAATSLLAILPAQAPSVTSPTVVRTRAVWFVESENPIGAEVGFAHDKITADAAVTQTLGDTKPGARIALGKEFWPALETFTDLKFGNVAVKAGNYYAVLERGKQGWSLGLLDPEKVRTAQLPPGIAKGQPLVAAIPLEAADRPAGDLQVTWETDKQPDTITLAIGIGNRVLRATATAKGAGANAPLVFPDQRGASRLCLGASDAAKVPCLVVDHGVVAWSDAVEKQARALAVGKRWRLGKDWATTFDSNVPLVLGGKKVAAGSWHLTMARSKDGWNLVLSPAEADHRARVDGFGADYVQAAIEVPLTKSTASPAAASLQLAFVQQAGKTELAITFGPERFAVAIGLPKS